MRIKIMPREYKRRFPKNDKTQMLIIDDNATPSMIELFIKRAYTLYGKEVWGCPGKERQVVYLANADFSKVMRFRWKNLLRSDKATEIFLQGRPAEYMYDVRYYRNTKEDLVERITKPSEKRYEIYMDMTKIGVRQ